MFKPTGFSEEIFKQRYAFDDTETWEQSARREAKQAAIAENGDKVKKYEDIFFEELVNNRFVSGGRIKYNSGRPNPNLLNCFVLSHDLDSRYGWGKLANEMIVTSMVGGGCVDADTEFFTGTSWKKISEYSNELVAQYNKGKLELVKPSSYIKLPAKELTHFTTKYGVDQVLCDSHRVIYENGANGEIQEILFKDLKEWHNNTVKGANVKFLTTFSVDKKGLDLSDNQLRLMVAFIADGTFYNDSGKGRFIFNKERKLDRLLSILKEENIKYETKKWNSCKLDAIICELPMNTKEFSSAFYDCSERQLKIICNEVLYWDGSFGEGNRIGSFSTSNKTNATFIQYAFHATGLRASILEDSRAENTNYKISPSTRTKPGLCSDSKNKPKMTPFETTDGFKYCFVVPSHALVLRRNGNIFITGNCGIDYSEVRPRGATISGQKGECPGPVELMKLIDGCAKPIKAGGQRRVALMFSLDITHPDIEEFLDAKLVKNELTHANVSVRSKHTTKFIEAVKADADWELSWKGQYKKIIKAKDLWNKIVENAWKTAEPGFLNWELVSEENNVHYVGELVSTNPCGELPLFSYDSCCLGHLVLPRFVENGDIKWDILANTIRAGVRFLDNILTVNTYPLAEMKEVSNKLRRIGLGTTGLADTLSLLSLQYGSEEGNKFIDKLYKFISKQAYEASIMLSIEKGPFSAFDAKKHLESGFMKRMPKKIRALVAEHGIRNCTILTLAPTGTVSIVSGNCSSGCEPIFAPAYERTFWANNERQVETVIHPLVKQFIDENKDLSHFIGSNGLNVKQHMEVQKIIQKHVDSSVSKTINIPKNYDIEDMSKMWLEYLPYLKGTTFYREGSRNYIDENGVEHQPPLKPITLKAALKKLNIKIDAEYVDNCPSGVCDF